MSHLEGNDRHAAVVVELRLHSQSSYRLGGASLLVDVRRLGAVEGVAAAAGQGAVLLLKVVLRSSMPQQPKRLCTGCILSSLWVFRSKRSRMRSSNLPTAAPASP